MSPAAIHNILKYQLKRKAPVEDLITNAAFENLSKKAVLYLTIIINGYLRLSSSPFRNHKKTTINQWTIANLFFLSKVLERLILNKFSEVNGHKLRNEKFSFRLQHSTTFHLVKLLDDLCIYCNNGNKTAAVFFDVESVAWWPLA